MKEDFLMTMVTRHDTGGEIDEIEMTSLAEFSGTADDYFITYCDDGDMKGCKTTLHVENGNCITMLRDGAYDSHMIIELNSRHISQHQTPYGVFSIGVSATKIESDMTEKGGTLRFCYCTDIELRTVTEIEFDIKIVPREV